MQCPPVGPPNREVIIAHYPTLALRTDSNSIDFVAPPSNVTRDIDVLTHGCSERVCQTGFLDPGAAPGAL